MGRTSKVEERGEERIKSKAEEQVELNDLQLTKKSLFCRPGPNGASNGIDAHTCKPTGRSEERVGQKKERCN